MLTSGGDMSERDGLSESELAVEWQEAIRQGVRDALENYELFGQVNIAPASISGEIDERGFVDLSPREQDFIKNVLFVEIGFDPSNPSVTAEYLFEAPDGVAWSGTAQVILYETARSKSEGMYLHEVRFPDGAVDYIVAPQDYRI